MMIMPFFPVRGMVMPAARMSGMIMDGMFRFLNGRFRLLMMLMLVLMMRVFHIAVFMKSGPTLKVHSLPRWSPAV